MKLLLVHPDDSPVDGPWSETRWDFVLDLGWAGGATYQEWERRMGCPVRGFHGFGEGPNDFRRVAEILSPCLGKLVDEQGLDWWEILAPLRIHEMLQVVLVKRALREVGAAEMVGTRFHAVAGLFARVGQREIRFVEKRSESALGRRFRNLRAAARRMTPAQILQVALDKWDMDYRLRARLTPRVRASAEAAVLLPSGYGNVTRMLHAYAGLLPERKFVLVTTRRSGTMTGLAGNVQSVSLAGYACSGLADSTRREVRALEDSWELLQEGPLRASEEIAWANESGWFGDVGTRLERWLRIRDAWRVVLDKEHIHAVLCGDENNPTNRIPVLLARKRKLPTLHCGHGALDILLPLRAPACDTYLVKGEMERDFMTRTFAIDPSRIEEGASAEPSSGSSRRTTQSGPGETIVFFSEQYELTQGRTRILYEELLPKLCALARGHGRRVIVKLHPFESPPSRRRLVDAVLSAEEREVVDLVHGPLSEELLANIWFGVTVESGVSVDCAIRGIPCFLCGWFATPVAGYEKQFVSYGAARRLESPEEILRIPEMLEGFEITPEVRRGLWNPITPARLEELLQKP